MFLNFVENIFASWEGNFVTATMFPEVGKQGNIDRKHNVSSAMFPSLLRGVYSSIIPPPPKGGGKESKALRAREGNQRRVKKKGREGKRKGRGKRRRRKGKGEREEKEKRIRVREGGKKYEGKGNE